MLHIAPAPLRRHARLQVQIGALLEPLARAAGLETVGEFNVGAAGDYRIPDCGLLTPGSDALDSPIMSGAACSSRCATHSAG